MQYAQALQWQRTSTCGSHPASVTMLATASQTHRKVTEPPICTRMDARLPCNKATADTDRIDTGPTPSTLYMSRHNIMLTHYGPTAAAASGPTYQGFVGSTGHNVAFSNVCGLAACCQPAEAGQTKQPSQSLQGQLLTWSTTCCVCLRTATVQSYIGAQDAHAC
jgi:hypothetical protein